MAPPSAGALTSLLCSTALTLDTPSLEHAGKYPALEVLDPAEEHRSFTLGRGKGITSRALTYRRDDCGLAVSVSSSSEEG